MKNFTYRKMKNILGVSLMSLAVLIGQVPMPDTQANQQSQNKSVNTITFNMNGGSFSGTYNNYDFKNQSPVLVVDDNEMIKNYPLDKYIVYKGFKTEKDIWYTDKECLQIFDKDSKVTDSITLYKKWYNVTKDGENLSSKGFYMNPEQTVLYKYDGNDKLVLIPDTVEIIAENAFENIGDDVRGISLPANIEEVHEEAFSGAGKGKNIIYVYDADTKQSEEIGKALDNKYEQLVHSVYLDVEDVEKIAGINFGENVSNLKESTNTEESQKSAESINTEKGSNSEEYTVTFDTGIPNVAGEKRTVLKGVTISEMVSVDDRQPMKLKKDDYTIEKDDGAKEITYVFQGWYKEDDFKNAWDFANDVVESNITLYAKWDVTNKAYYFVKFTADGAENVPDSIKVYENEKLIKPEKEPKIKGKTFKGWYTDMKDTTKKFTGWDNKITSNLELFARWEDKGYTVTFDMNGGTFTGSYDGTKYSGASSVVNKIIVGKGISSAEYPEKDTSAIIKHGSYTTDSNWYTDKECLSLYSKTDSGGKDIILSKDITLYKKWYYTKSGFVLNPAGTVLYKYYGGDKAVVIPDTVTTIGKNAFADVTGVESITIHENLTDIRDDAFSGAKNIAKDIKLLMAKDTEKAKNIVKDLDNKYSHLVYKEVSDADNKEIVIKESSDSDKSSVVTVTKSGSIKIGAEIKTGATTNNNNTSAQIVNMPSGNVITIGDGNTTVGNSETKSGINSSASGTVSSVVTTVPDASVGNITAVNNPAVATVNSTAANVTNADKPLSNQNAVKQNTTVKSNFNSASAPRSTQHIKDATPKTGDAVQYRIILACVLFSAGMLLLLTGNGNKRKAASS